MYENGTVQTFYSATGLPLILIITEVWILAGLVPANKAVGLAHVCDWKN